MKHTNKQCYEILLTYGCNAQCLFCSQGDFNKGITAPFETIIKQIYRARKDGYVKLGLSGGEPTIRKDLAEIVKAAKKIGFNFIRIQTNGIKLKDYDLCKNLVDSGLTFCKFSFTSHKPEIHNKLVNIQNAWESALKGLQNMKKLKVRLGNNILITKYNYKDLKSITKFFLDKGITNFVIIYPIYTGNMHKNKEIGIPLPLCKKYFIETIELMEKNSILDEILFLNVPPCILEKYYQRSIGLAPFNTLVTSPDGIITNLDKNTNETKIKGKICKECTFSDKCSGIDINYIKVFGWHGFKPIKDINNQKNQKKYFTDNEKCLIEILKRKNNIDTAKILEIAKKIPLCHDCVDGNNVINTAAKLVAKNIIKMEFKKGRYYFKLK